MGRGESKQLNSRMLLVEVQVRTTSLENCVAVSVTSIPLLGYMSTEMHVCVLQKTGTRIYCGTMYNNQRVKTTQIAPTVDGINKLWHFIQFHSLHQ